MVRRSTLVCLTLCGAPDGWVFPMHVSFRIFGCYFSCVTWISSIQYTLHWKTTLSYVKILLATSLCHLGSHKVECCQRPLPCAQRLWLRIMSTAWARSSTVPSAVTVGCLSSLGLREGDADSTRLKRRSMGGKQEQTRRTSSLMLSVTLTILQPWTGTEQNTVEDSGRTKLVQAESFQMGVL